MVTALYVIGAIVLIIAVVAGFSSGSFWGFLAVIAGGLSSAIILFALAKILENQYEILNKLYHQGSIANRTFEKKVCLKCNYKYDIDYSSCPHCGHKE